jgi:hypothetical protein
MTVTLLTTVSADPHDAGTSAGDTVGTGTTPV